MLSLYENIIMLKEKAWFMLHGPLIQVTTDFHI